jgi:uncharacterized protein
MSGEKRSFPYRRALVTGASSGLGAALCRKLLENGCAVWGIARDVSRITVEGVTPVALDLSDAAALGNFLAKDFPAIDPDLLVNNAGCGIFGDLADNSEADIRAQLDVMLAAPALLCAAALPRMLERGQGCIVNVSSLAAVFPLPCMPLYNAAKSGLTALSRSMMEEVRNRGVCVVDFQPGDFSSGFLKATRRVGGAERAWSAAEKHLVVAPDADWMAREMFQTIVRGRSGTVRAGTFFQAKLAPFGQRFLPDALVNRIQRMYLG